MGFIIKTRQGSGMRKFNMFGPARTDLNRLYIFTYSLKYVIITVGQGRQAGRPAGRVRDYAYGKQGRFSFFKIKPALGRVQVICALFRKT